LQAFNVTQDDLDELTSAYDSTYGDLTITVDTMGHLMNITDASWVACLKAYLDGAAAWNIYTG